MKKFWFILFLVGILAIGALYVWENRDKFFQGELSQQRQEDDSKRYEHDIYGSLAIIQEDCSSGCINFDFSEDKKYCEEICVLAKEERRELPNNCNDLEGFKKDDCWKRRAFEAQSQGLCNHIKDAEIRKKCYDRLIEELIEDKDTSL